MIVYRERRTPCRPRDDLSSVVDRARTLARARTSADDWLEVLIDAGELHAACVDALCPARDEEHPAVDAVGTLLDAAAQSWLAVQAGGSTAPWTGRMEDVLRQAEDLPASAERSVPEGFAYYSLYPEMYVAAARAAVHARGARHVVVIGLRSIGSTLAAVASAALSRDGVTCWTRTLRPRGHPFERQVHLGPALARAIAERRTHLFLVVDEGPGLSGSSLASAAEALRAAGVPDEHVVLVPGYQPGIDALRSPAARDAFRRHAVVTGTFETQILAGGLHGIAAGDLQDVSAGRWRQHVSDVRAHAPSHPHHERRKYLAATADGPRLMVFEGLGRYGRRALTRATRLADAGFIAPPIALDRGFLSQSWHAEAGPIDAVLEPAAIRRIGGYIGWMARSEATGDACDVQPLAAMLEANTRESLGERAVTRAAQLSVLGALAVGPAARLDARLLRHEWFVSRGVLFKADALHHHDDHFFPGPCDAAWDVAGAIVEFALGEGAARALVETAGQAGGDRSIARRLPFFLAAYAAFRLGYATLAAETLAGTMDGARFADEARRYRRALQAALAREPNQAYSSPVSFTPSSRTPSS